jgi:hypothetical protein
MQTLPAEELEDEFDAITDIIASDERFIEAETHSETDIHLGDYSFEEVVELGRELGVETFYGILEEGQDEVPQWARLFFFHEGSAHVQYIESEELAEVREEETDEQLEEFEQKQDLAAEILDNYSELLDDATEYRLQHNVDSMSMEQLFRKQDRLQEEKEEKEREERIDEERELELAKAVYNDDRFHGRFNQTDVEMLLDRMDVEFDDETVRISEIDRKAKSLLKVEE